MKFTITMKDPDGYYDCFQDAVKSEVQAIPGLSQAERDAILEVRKENVGEVLSRWFEYGEYLRVEVDTDAGTAIVLPVKR